MTDAEPSPTEPFFELSLDLLVAAGFDGYIKRANPAWERTLGWSQEELRAIPYVEFIHPEDVEDTVAEVLKLAEPGTETRDFEIRVRTKEGPYRVLLFSATGAPEDGVVYAVAKDITERKAAVAALERSNAELEQFAYVASHDLSEPLRMVSGFVSLLEERYAGKLGSDADEFIGYIVDGVDRMQALIRDLLAYSRIGRDALNTAPVDMSALARHVLDTLGPAIEESDGTVELGDLPTVRGDATQLSQLLQNLIGNGLKFSGDAPPLVRVVAERNGTGWRFAVIDNGIGIEPRFHDRVFQVFQRLHGPADYPGTGIGLAICHTIVVRHGGRIWIEPTTDGGSTVLFTLPDAPEEGVT